MSNSKNTNILVVHTAEENIKKLEKFTQENSVKNSHEFIKLQLEIAEYEAKKLSYENELTEINNTVKALKENKNFYLSELRKEIIQYMTIFDEIIISLSKDGQGWMSYHQDLNVFDNYRTPSGEYVGHNLNKDIICSKHLLNSEFRFMGDRRFSNSIRVKNNYEHNLNTNRKDYFYTINSQNGPWKHSNLIYFSSLKNLIESDNSYKKKEQVLDIFLENKIPIRFVYLYSERNQETNKKLTKENINSFKLITSGNEKFISDYNGNYSVPVPYNCYSWVEDLELNKKYQILTELNDIESETKEILVAKNKKVSIIETREKGYYFNYDLLLKNYNIDNTEHNLVDYYGNIKKWIDDLNNEVSQVTNAYKDVFSTINNYQTKQRNLNFIDNSAFEERKTIFERYLIGNPEEFYKTLFSIGEKAKEYELKVNEATNNFDFKLLTELEREERPSFSLIAKNTGEQWNNYAKQLSEVSNNLPRINRTIDIHEKEMKDWNLLIQRKENYLSKEDIDKNLLDSWFEEWSFEYIELSRKVNNLLESYLRNVVDENSFNFILEELYNFRKNLDKLYEEEVIGTHYKFAFVPGGDLQESLERKSLKFKFIIQSIDNIEKLIFSVENPITRRFLIKWNNMWFSNEILENINRFSSSDYDEVMIALNRDFIKMKEDNFKEFYNDVDAYINHKKEREKEYNSLIFKMRKEIAKQYANKQV